MTIKLEEKSIELGGKKYVLHVNMSVLDRLQETCGGEINLLMQKSLNDGMVDIMAAMLNDWCEDQGWEQDWTPRKVKKYFTVAMRRELDVLGMFVRGMTPPGAVNAKAEAAKTKNTEPEKSGN